MLVIRPKSLTFVTAQLRSFALLIAAWSNVTPILLFGQLPQQQLQANVVVSGRVVTQRDTPVSSAEVVLKSLDSSSVLSAVTDSSGRFTFRFVGPGAHTITCNRGTLQSQTLRLEVGTRAVEDVRLIVSSERSSESNPRSGSPVAGSTMEFSDRPHFTVAGVTDWTAVGGHGSDATLRTSEDLTRETLALKTPPLESGELSKPQHVSGDYEAETRLRAALAIAPENYTNNRELGRYYLHSDRFQLAIPLLQSASKLNGGQAEDEYELALAYQGSGAFALARQQVQLALAHADDANLHQLMGDLDEKLGDPLSAVHELERATQLEPSERNYFDWASELLLHRAIWQAAEVFSKGTRVYPSSIRLKTGRGAALFAGALYDEAAQQLCDASDLDPANEEPYLFLGKIVSVSQVPPSCVKSRLRRFLELQPASAASTYLYATFLLKEGTPFARQDAETLFRKTVAANPKSSDAYLQLGILSYEQKNYSEATDFFIQAIQVDPQQAEAHYRLAVAYDRVGKSEEARKQFSLHSEIVRAQAEATEQERRQVKQFLIVLQGDPAKPGSL